MGSRSPTQRIYQALRVHRYTLREAGDYRTEEERKKQIHQDKELDAQ